MLWSWCMVSVAAQWSMANSWSSWRSSSPCHLWQEEDPKPQGAEAAAAQAEETSKPYFQGCATDSWQT